MQALSKTEYTTVQDTVLTRECKQVEEQVCQKEPHDDFLHIGSDKDQKKLTSRLGSIFEMGEVEKHNSRFLGNQINQIEETFSVKIDQAECANKLREMLFVTINTGEEDHERIMEFFDLDESELPSMRISSCRRTCSSSSPSPQS